MVYTSAQNVFFPYCLKKTKAGYVVLNRDYKPLGYHSTYVDYEKFSTPLKITKQTARALSYSGSDNTKEIFLYDDRTNPANGVKNEKAYFKRLKILMNNKMIFQQLPFHT